MIIIIENGQFGNQLFQFNFCLRILKKNEKIIFIGFEDLSKFIKKNNQFNFLKKNIFSKLIIKFRYLIIKKIIYRFKITNTILEDTKGRITKNRGLINFITFVDGHFEKENLIKDDFIYYLKELKIENKAKKYLERFKKKKKKIFFIHIRLKDNLVGIDKKYPSVLPLIWFFKCINLIKKKNRNSLFIFLSDDINFLKKNLNKNEIYIKDNNPFYNLLIMKNCDGGVLSPSTFSWWAAFLSKKKDFYAPEFWHGHRRKKFHPINFKSRFLRYIPVKKIEYLTQIRQEMIFYKVLPFK
jgi:hypothetical protein